MSGVYKEPDSFMSQEWLVDQLGATEGHRLSRIVGRLVIYEPQQFGVHRYPPVQVQVERNLDDVRNYVNMPPTDWSKILKNT